jgi:SAM-dependent methyltransferase
MRLEFMPPLSVIQKAVLKRLPTLKLPARGQVLDAPCGAGALCQALTQAGFEVWGADVDPGCGARLFLKERFLPADFNTHLPCADSSMEAVFCVEGIEHLENRYAFLREAFRILRPGGTLVLTTPNIVSLRSRVRFLGSGFFHKDPRPLNESARHPLHHIGLSTFPDLRYGLHTSGFVLTKVACTHTKLVSYLYAFLAPWIWLYTGMAFRKEKDPEQRERNREIYGTLGSPALLFGENLMLTAVKPLTKA